MNQILAVKMPSEKDKKKKSKKKNNKKAGTKSVVIFFCILLLILGVSIIAIGARVYLNSGIDDNNTITENTIVDTPEVSKPVIEIITGSSSLDITITSENEIDYIIYSWDDEEETQVNGNEEYEMELTISIPEGTSTLTITAKDINGEEATYTNQYTKTGEEFIPTITLEQDDNTINIIIESETTLDYVSYTFDDETEIEEDINDTVIEIPIEITSGEHSLSVTVVDINGDIYEDTKSFSIPSVTVGIQGEEFAISISSSIDITTVEITLNGEEQDEITVNDTEYETMVPLDDDIDVNKIIIKVNTTNGSYTRRVKYERTDN